MNSSETIIEIICYSAIEAALRRQFKPLERLRVRRDRRRMARLLGQLCGQRNATSAEEFFRQSKEEIWQRMLRQMWAFPSGPRAYWATGVCS